MARSGGTSLDKAVFGQEQRRFPRLWLPRRASSRCARLLTYLAVSYWTVRGWVESGKMRAVRLPGDGRLLRIEVAELDRLVEECRDA